MIKTVFAMAGGQAGGDQFFASLLPLILIVVIFYLLILRPQAKKQKERTKMLEALKKGDQVVTVGGIHGKIVGMKKDGGDVLILKVDDNVKLEVDRSAVASVVRQAKEK